MTDYSARCITFTGASHKRRDMVCQDHSGFVVKQNYSLAIVADGHGSKIRSEIGSRFAIEACMDSVERMLSDSTSSELNDGRLDELKKAISNSWLDKVSYYHDEHKLSNEEIRKAGMPSSSKDIFALYGTTLVAAVMTEKFVLVLQMGDGGCAMVFDDGRALIANTLDKSCDDIHTTSLSNPYSYKHMHHFLIPSDEKLPVALAVFTDGFEVQENQDLIDSIVGIVARLGGDDHDWFTAICPEIEERTHHYNDDDDDVSLSIIFDRNIDFITLYNKTFHKEYPFYEEHPSPLDFKSRISTAATKDGWDVTENVTLVDNGGNVISGQFTNGKLTQKILPEKMLEPWDHYDLMYKNFKEVPNDSEFVCRTILQLISHVKDKDHCDVNAASRILFFAMQRIQSLIRSYSLPIDSGTSIDQLLKSLDLEDKTLPKTDSDLGVLISNYQGIWYEDKALDSRVPTGSSKVFKLLYDGELQQGERCGEGIEYLDEGKEYRGQFSKGLKNGKGTLFSKGIPFFYGSFKDDKREGFGVELKFERNQVVSVVTADYKDDVMDGPCQIFSLKPGSSKVRIEKSLEPSEWKSLCEEPGWITTFIGSFKNGYRDGKGIEIDIEKESGFVGIFSNGQHAKGWRFDIDPNDLSDGYRPSFESSTQDDYVLKRAKSIRLIFGGQVIAQAKFHDGNLLIPRGWYDFSTDEENQSRNRGDLVIIDSNKCVEQLLKFMDLRDDSSPKGDSDMGISVCNRDGNWYEDKALDSGVPAGSSKVFKLLYDGEFQQGKRSGKGRECLDGGRDYQGQFKKGLKNGKGTLFSKGIPFFYGSFKDDKREGFGVELKFKRNQVVSIVKAYYKDNVMDGPCQIVSLKPDSMKDRIEKSLEPSEWKSLCEEPGWITTFSGFFKNDYRDGRGILIDIEKKREFVGIFSNGQLAKGWSFNIDPNELPDGYRPSFESLTQDVFVSKRAKSVRLIFGGQVIAQAEFDDGNLLIPEDWYSFVYSD